MGFKSEKVSIKDIVQRELAEIDAYLFEDGEIVKYEIALESVPEKIRKYARENQVIYGFEEEKDKVKFMKKQDFIKSFSAEYCANHRENVKEQTLESEMFAFCARKRKKRLLLPLTLLIIVLFAAAVGFGASYIQSLSDSNDGTVATIAQLEKQVKLITRENNELQLQLQTLENEKNELQTQNDTLTEEKESLAEEAEKWRANEEKIGWFNANAVLVYQDGADLYHTYGCTRHQDVAPSIYDVARAKASGYLACPHCLGE